MRNSETMSVAGGLPGDQGEAASHRQMLTPRTTRKARAPSPEKRKPVWKGR